MLHHKMMSDRIFIRCLFSLVIISFHADFTEGSLLYYISPSPNVLCPQNPCLSLTQFAANYTHHINSGKDIALFFLPGHHVLHLELTLNNVDRFSMLKNVQETVEGAVFIECTSQEGRLNINNTTSVLIADLHFIGCGGNSLAYVNHFVVEDTLFEGVVDTSRALILHVVDTATLVRCFFFSNTLSFTSTNASDLYAGGALISFTSSLSITNCTFTNNSAYYGAALDIFTSSVNISDSTFTNNLASEGGVIYSFFKSSFTIANSTFNDNLAFSGGVIEMFDSLFDISDSVFTHNHGSSYGGAIYASTNSFLTITDSTFADNVANHSGVIELFQSSTNIDTSTFTNNGAYQGGVMRTFQSSFSIYNCSFLSNRATGSGGVLKAYKSSFKVTTSTFTRNRAVYGGVINAQRDIYVSITNSNFTENYATNGGVMDITSEPSFSIVGSTFTGNGAASNGGVILARLESLLVIFDSIFIRNSARTSGGVMETLFSSISITNSTFTRNVASDGAVVHMVSNASFTDACTLCIINSTFTENKAFSYGGVLNIIHSSNTVISNGTFSDNFASYGGVISTSVSSGNIFNSLFTGNKVSFGGGAMHVVSGSVFYITNCTFTNSRVTNDNIENTPEDAYYDSNITAPSGGVIITSESSFLISFSLFTNNRAPFGGVIESSNYSHVIIANSTFDANRAYGGGVIDSFLSSFTITRSRFNNNDAVYRGGVITAVESSFDFANSTLTENNAKFGGIIFAGTDLNLSISQSTVFNNTATLGTLLDTTECSLHIHNSSFAQNIGSIRSFSCNVTVSGHSSFENSKEPLLDSNIVSVVSHVGGAITAYDSNIVFTGVSKFYNNQASYGGAILSTESTIIIIGETTIVNNVATNKGGGGIYLHKSDVKIKGICNVLENQGMNGGGIYADSTTIDVNQPGILRMINNSADIGGGIYFQGSPRLNVLKHHETDEILVLFVGNHASFGGALYVADNTTSSACSYNVECFIQTLALNTLTNSLRQPYTVNIYFSDNYANELGSNLFGGHLDRCVPSPFAEIYFRDNLYSSIGDGITYLGNISNLTLDSISSPPVRVCFCNSNFQPDCSYELDPIMVMKGEGFTVSLVAVDQASHPVDASITSLLTSSQGGLNEGQQTQTVYSNCTDVHFNVFSPNNSETITVFADGPCGSSLFSTKHVQVHFLDCTCLIGFKPSEKTPTNCQCDCDPLLSPYIVNCDYSSTSLVRVDTKSWITYVNDSDHSPGYVIHPYCPYDYCYNPFVTVSINLNLPNGSDAQCAYNRMGVLCGACPQALSLSLGSSQCLSCHGYWPAVLFAILVAAIIAGMLLVTALLALKLTVANGLITGFIFYANIVGVSGSTFFSSSTPKFAAVFIAWLNLDIGFDICFIDGLDTYAKTWLQLAFPIYIISLVVAIIICGRYFPKFARLIGRRDPVATLATLVLLSYAKMLSVTIQVLSFATLKYPDGSKEIVWLPDGNVKFFQGKHIVLVVAVLLIILIGVPYTLLLFCWQWLVRIPRWKMSKWTRNTKLNAFITTYHAPFNSKYRYWTGLLLFVRVVLYVTAAVTESANPKISPLVTIFLVGGLVFLKGAFGIRIYNNSFVDIVDMGLNFNILALAVFSLYGLKSVAEQIAVVYTSTIITLTLLVGVIFYHITLLFPGKCKRHSIELDEYSPTSTHSNSNEITYSIVEAPSRESPSPEEMQEYQVRLIECIDTGRYMTD